MTPITPLTPDIQNRRFAFTRPPELDGAGPRRRPVVIAGGGPVGLTLALDLARRGHEVVVLNRRDRLAHGSRAICFSKRSLDIFHRLGVAAPMVDKGVIWNVGKVFHGADPDPVYEFDMLPVKHQRNPGFINLQQYYVESVLIDALAGFDNAEIRWASTVTQVTAEPDGVVITVDTQGGPYALHADYLLACDGANSPIRAAMGLDFEGRAFDDSFLIADVTFKETRPSERWFWFDPPFPGGSALLHKQPDNVWRLDFQLGPGADLDAAVKPENVDPFVRGMLGPDVSFQYEWISAYRFQCRRMARFVHGRVIFLGDSAHLVSPFGARGCNGGLADADNLGWKLDRVLRGLAAPALLESYDAEAVETADENILNSTRATDFITPKSHGARLLRDAVLALARPEPALRPFVNSGRLSAPVSYAASPLSTPDGEPWSGGPAPGAPGPDAPVDWCDGDGFLLDRLGGRFALLAFHMKIGEADRRQLARQDVAVLAEGAEFTDTAGLAADRYGAAGRPALYLMRPDQYAAARWRTLDRAGIEAALARAGAKDPAHV
ncbi:MAG: FAD-dependent oxidoreductase [Oceanicaulis sp.]